jgi:hypothetical protein
MARKVFFSFHYDPDKWRASQVRNMGALEGNVPCSDNDWESVKKGGEAGIQRWIAGQLSGRSCAVVLVGADTASRKWVIYEIQESWNANKGVVGVRIHNLKDQQGNHSAKGANPFDQLTLQNGTKRLSSIVKLYDPPGWASTDVYAHIKDSLADWVDEAIEIRNGS